ncbi:MAG: hypothetical protein EOM20_10785 [Spartobacteria bacterium]|nr:hypothetical protein [Spartobacteria bacterium]
MIIYRRSTLCYYLRRRLWMAAFLLLWAPCAPAIQFESKEAFTTGEADVLDDEYWVYAKSTDLAGHISDDLFLLTATTSVLSGQFESELWCISGMLLTLSGTVSNDARLMGRTVEVTGHIGSALMAGGSAVHVTREAEINKDVILVGEELIFEGTTLDGRLFMAGNKVTLSGKIARSVRLIAKDIVVMPGTVIEGDLVYTCEKELILGDKVVLNGELKRKEMSEAIPTTTPTQNWARSVALQVYFCAAAGLVGLVWLGVFPRFSNRSVNCIRQSALRSAMFGLLTLLGLPAVCSFIAVTVVGLPLAGVLMALYLLGIYVGKIMAAFALGTIATRLKNATRMSQSVTALFVGLLLLYGGELIPIIGPYISFGAVIVGLGAAITVIFTGRTLGLQAPEEPPELPALSEQ